MSTKSVAEKLQIKAGMAIWLSHPDRVERLGALPAGAYLVAELGQAALAVIFADSAAPLRTLLEAHRGELALPGILWVAYPKANRADINRDTLWPILAEYGMRPVMQVAVDDVWSALRFRMLRPGEKQFREE